jgi:hypothetical protein
VTVLQLIFSNFFHTYGTPITNALKKVTSICLILLLLFNALGFYGLLQGLRYKTTQDLVKRLDNHRYSEDETILLKIPVAVPYQIDSEDYERVDGEFEHEGEFYRLVKQKYQNDTLFMVCIKDHTTKRIEQAVADYVKTFTDKPVDAKHNGKVINIFIKDFLPSHITIKSISTGWHSEFVFGRKTPGLTDLDQSIISPPPRG